MNRRSKNLRCAASLAVLCLLAAAAVGCKKKDGEADAPSSTASPTSVSSDASRPAAVAGPDGANTGASGAAGVLPAGEGALDTATLPAIVADVNGTKITKEELVRGAQAAQSKMARVGQRVALTPDFYKQVLDELIADRLLQQEAKAAGFSASGPEIEARLAMIKAQLPSEDAYKQVLQANGVSDQRFKESLGKGILVEKYVREKLVPSVKISDDEVRKYYDGNRPQFAVPEAVHVRHILIKVEPGAAQADRQKAKAKAEELLKKAQGGEDFGQLASQNSDDPGSKGRGGDLGFVERGKTPPAFEKAVFALAKPGDLSGVVETQVGYHIVQLGERRQPSVLEFEQVRERIGHVLQERRALETLRGRVQSLRSSGKVQTFLPS